MTTTGTSDATAVQAAFILVMVDDTEIERNTQVQEGNNPRYNTPLHDAVREFASVTLESQVLVLAGGLILARSCR